MTLNTSFQPSSPNKKSAAAALVVRISFGWMVGFSVTDITTHKEEMRAEKNVVYKRRVACLRELKQDIRLLMDTLAVAEIAPLTFALTDSHFNYKTEPVSDKLTRADRELLLYSWHRAMCFFIKK